MARNVLGGELEPCSFDPLTGFMRDGCCNSHSEDAGVHLVCAEMTEAFLAFSFQQGNDPHDPRSRIRLRRSEAGRPVVLVRLALAGGVRAGAAPRVHLAATHARAIEWCSLEALTAHSADT